MSRALAAVGLALLLGCVSSLERGERLYQQGNPLDALEVWRTIPASARERAAARERIAAVEKELTQLAVRYRQRGAFFAERDRLAESVLNYRLALRVDPDDRETLDRVQELSRSLARRKHTHREAFEEAFAEEELVRAREEMQTLTTLDPFDPDLATREQALEQALRAKVSALLAQGRKGFHNGDYDDAEAAFRAALELAPRHETARGYLGFIATVRQASQHTGRPPAAFRALDFRASDAEIRAEGYYQNALAAERSGDPFAAIRYAQAAVEQNPDHRPAREHMAQLRERLRPRVSHLVESGRDAFVREDLERALDLWRRALLIDPHNTRAREYADRAERMLANLERLRTDAADDTDVAAPGEAR